jgi:hypothetical protein
MMISDDLVERLSHEAGRRLERKARIGRLRALGSLAECRVLLTRDGTGTWEEVFNGPPTLGQLTSRAGAAAFIVRLAMRAKTARRNLVQVPKRIAAEQHFSRSAVRAYS